MPNVHEQLYHDDQTLRKVYDTLRDTGLSESETLDAINEMQNKGLLFREAARSYIDNKPHSRSCGIQRHDHGEDCRPDCPTCYGQNNWREGFKSP
jgi:hypothetical protein